jgi:hypothetical protein
MQYTVSEHFQNVTFQISDAEFRTYGRLNGC